MGAILSCLCCSGSDDENPEREALIGPTQQISSPYVGATDSYDTVRRQELLNKIVNRTGDSLIDIYAISQGDQSNDSVDFLKGNSLDKPLGDPTSKYKISPLPASPITNSESLLLDKLLAAAKDNIDKASKMKNFGSLVVTFDKQ